MTTRKSSTEFRFVGTHVDDLADGRILEPGSLYQLDEEAQEHPHNQRLVDAGLLVSNKPEPAKEGDS